jgi:hypothetical protein
VVLGRRVGEEVANTLTKAGSELSLAEAADLATEH